MVYIAICTVFISTISPLSTVLVSTALGNLCDHLHYLFTYVAVHFKWNQLNPSPPETQRSTATTVPLV